MLGPHSQLHSRAAALRLLAAMAFVVFAGCAATPPQQAAAGEEAQDESDADAPAGEAQALAPEAVDRTALPNQELDKDLLYEFLLAEIAGQRGNVGLSAQAYVDLAKRTRDPRIARRATEVALYARMNDAAIDAARVWHETDPGSARPLQALAGLLEAQLLQKVSVDQAASLLAAFLEQYPAARETRLAYARMLVAQKRFADARAEFQKLIAGTPDSTDMAFAVALLSLQLKDYDAAERYWRGLLEGQYRDKDGVRLYLGQVAEERNNLPEALRWYGEVGEGEQYVPAQMRYAQILARQGKLDAARAHLQQAAAKSSQQRVQLVLAEAQLLREANQPKTAFDLVGQALDRLPNNPELLYDYAMLAEKIERVDVLEASLRKLIEIRPETAHAYNP